MNRIDMQRVVNGVRYNTETAELVADDVYWDGHNLERHGRNTWLYRPKRHEARGPGRAVGPPLTKNPARLLA